jgi:hypothetical protein
MKMVASFTTYILSLVAVLALITVIVIESAPPARLDLMATMADPDDAAMDATPISENDQ